MSSTNQWNIGVGPSLFPSPSIFAIWRGRGRGLCLFCSDIYICSAAKSTKTLVWYLSSLSLTTLHFKLQNKKISSYNNLFTSTILQIKSINSPSKSGCFLWHDTQNFMYRIHKFILKSICAILARRIRPPCMVTDRWLSHQISSQLTQEKEDHGGPNGHR